MEPIKMPTLAQLDPPKEYRNEHFFHDTKGKIILTLFAEECKPDKGFSFWCFKGQDETIIQRMRVAYTRAKESIVRWNTNPETARKKVYATPNFKIYRNSAVEEVQDPVLGVITRITLTKVLDRQVINPEVQKDLDALMKGLING